MLSCLKFYSCYITKIEQVIFGPSGWGALGATDLRRTDLQNNLYAFWLNQFTQTRSNQNHLDWSRFPSRCHRVKTFRRHRCAKLLAVTHIGATELPNSEPPTAHGYIYLVGPNGWNFSNLPRSRTPLPPSPRSPDHRLVSSAPSPPEFVAVNGNLLRCWRRRGSPPS
jgi:hypothetical protein